MKALFGAALAAACILLHPFAFIPFGAVPAGAG
jgi:hypothetical protein